MKSRRVREKERFRDRDEGTGDKRKGGENKRRSAQSVCLPVVTRLCISFPLSCPDDVAALFLFPSSHFHPLSLPLLHSCQCLGYRRATTKQALHLAGAARRKLRRRCHASSDTRRKRSQRTWGERVAGRDSERERAETHEEMEFDFS